MKKLVTIIFVFGLSHFWNNANAQGDLLEALAYALKHPEQFQAVKIWRGGAFWASSWE